MNNIQSPTPLLDESDDILEDEVPQKIDYKAKDTLLYNNWATTKSKGDMTRLVNHLNPIINKAVTSVAGSVPTSTLSGEAKLWTIKAIKTFDPSKGFALGTHVTNYIKRIKRVNYKYQNAVRLPEHMQTEFHKWNSAKQQLSDELNGEPTPEDIAKRLAWPVAKVKRFNDRVYSDLIESADEHPSTVSEYSDGSILMKSLMSNLTEEEKTILENSGRISSTELAKKLNLDTNALNYRKKKLRSKIEMLKMELGL